MRADLLSGACPGFGFRKCFHCKNNWLSTSPDICVVINRYCPQCIPLICDTLKDWQLDPRYGPLPERKSVEARIKAAIEKHRRRRDLSVQHQRKLIQTRRGTS
jgi:hypothetical protein